MNYANDLPLTDLLRHIKNGIADLDASLRDGHLDTAFLEAHKMVSKLESLKERLNDIKYRKVA